MTYLETRKLVKKIVIEKGVYNISGADITHLYNLGCNVIDIQNSIDYFKYSPQTKKYRDR